MSFEKSLASFFKQGKSKLKSHEIRICMGNESCDIDSFVSSLVTAIHEKAIHVINMSRRIFESKGDLMHLVSLYGIDLDDLVFLERPKGAFSLEAKRHATVFKTGGEEHRLADKHVAMVLVDHHRPVPELDHCPIDLIIDHHVPGSKSLTASRIYVDVDIGSCATLVCKYIGHSLFHAKFNKQSEFESNSFCMHIAKLLMIPILVDTSNFKKVTSHFDRGEFDKLKKLAKTKKREINKIRKDLKKARLNDSGMATDLILQKDFKAYTYRGLFFGIATVKYSFKKWVDREAKENGHGGSKAAGKHLEFALNAFRREYGLDFLMLNRKNGSERLVALVNCAFERLLAEDNNFKQLDYRGFKYYKIPVEKSRKIMLPIIKDLMDRLHSLDDSKFKH